MCLYCTLEPAVQQEVLHLKDQISHQSRNNFKLEKDLRFLDSKIALLIAHKITAEVREGGRREGVSSNQSLFICIVLANTALLCFRNWKTEYLMTTHLTHYQVMSYLQYTTTNSTVLMPHRRVMSYLQPPIVLYSFLIGR